MGFLQRAGTFAGKLFGVGGKKQQTKTLPKYGSGQTHTDAMPPSLGGWEGHQELAKSLYGNNAYGFNSQSDLDDAMARYREEMDRAIAKTRGQMQQDLEKRAAEIFPPTSPNAYDDRRLAELAMEAEQRNEERRRYLAEQEAMLDPLARFLHGEMVSVISSNVSQIQYDFDLKLLYVIYLNGGWYQYALVTPEEAAAFFNAGSKGKWVWDVLRQRGTQFGWKKPYTFMGFNLGGYKPKYMDDIQFQIEHAAIPPSGSIPDSWLQGKGPYSVPWLVNRNKKLFPHAKVYADGEEHLAQGTFLANL